MRLFEKNVLSIAHLPTWMLIVGYPIYWLELFSHRNNHGVTFPLAWIVWGLLLLFVVFIHRRTTNDYKDIGRDFSKYPSWERIFVISGLVLTLIILTVCAYAAYFPPHLMQEADVLNYHYTFPRQHLIRNSFNYIPWSTCDLFPYPIQFALAPFWFATVLPNKYPQFFFLIGVLLITVRVASQLKIIDVMKKLLIAFSVLAAHHVGIQAGTAMLDLVILYLFLAALDSFLRRDYVLAAIEFCFYFWSKSFIPFQTVFLIVAIVGIVWCIQKFGFQIYLDFSQRIEQHHILFREHLSKFTLAFLICSVFVAAPFLAKSLYCAGTPIYPFFVGTFFSTFEVEQTPEDWQKFQAATQEDLSMRDAYGIERTLKGFVLHLWLIAVPEEGVNNRFDYPIGLVYLLCLGPFIYFFVGSIFAKRLSLIPIFIVLFWMSWWLGSQQSRFLYIPMVLMYIVVLLELRPTRMLWLLILMALSLNLLSIVRAHRTDWGKERVQVLLPADKRMVGMNKEYLQSGRSDKLYLTNTDISYAQFPVRVTKEKFPYIIPIHTP